MGTLFRPAHREQVLQRVGALRPDSQRQWGRMSSHQAVCHLNDFFRAVLGDRPLPAQRVTVRRQFVRFVAFTLPLRWPRGFRTSAELDAERGGTRPAEFAGDVTELKALVSRFVATDGRTLAPHYAWGALTRGEWGRYAWRHLDHHLRQFNV